MFDGERIRRETSGDGDFVVGRADDPAEIDADMAAERALRVLDDAGHAGGGPREPRRHRIRRAARVGAEGGPVDDETRTSVDTARRTGGSELPIDVRQSMEQGFGASLSNVRVHTGPQAADLNDRLSARAFTIGSDVFFRDGLPDTSTSDGRHLVAHELAHTLQDGTTTRRVIAPPRQTSIRRMPTAASIKQRTNKESKSGTKFFGKRRGATNSYNEVLAAVTDYKNFLSSTEIPANEALLGQQLPGFKNRLDRIVAAATAYKAKSNPDPAVVTVCDEMIQMAPAEFRAAHTVGLNYIRSTGAKPFGRDKWILHMPRDPRSAVAAVTGTGGKSGKGANKSVEPVTKADNTAGFFAKDDPTGMYQGKEWSGPKGMFQVYGMNDPNLRLGNRSIAMSRLDQLLGAGVIARTEAATKNGEVGTFMKKAEGLEGAKALANTPELIADPALPRLLSKLQLIDAIAGQIDRHAANYFIQTDSTGKVTGVTGIDLDMAWMPKAQPGAKAKVDVEQGSRMQDKDWTYDWFPGLSKFVDAELAEAILKITPLDLRSILVDLLDDQAVEGAIDRLTKLQAALQKLKSDGKLLAPNDWTNVVRAKAVTEESVVEKGRFQSYYAREGKYALEDLKKKRDKV